MSETHAPSPPGPPAAPPVVAIVGRPNVGKSTLFNRIVGRRLAVVLDTPGVTRDRHYTPIAWGRLAFVLVDTGGVDEAGSDALGREVGGQSLRTLDEADLVLFMTDAREGLLPADRELAGHLRRAGVPVIHLVNKSDTEGLSHQALEAAHLGFDPVIPLSAEHGRGLDELYDALAARLPAADLTARPEAEVEGGGMVRVAVVGRPNTGKSTLVNRLLGEERLVVSDIPGTTRDAIDSVLAHKGTPYLFIDTAGLRRRGRIGRGVERASVSRTMDAVERAEVVVLMMDAVEGVTDQDTKIAGQILEAGRGCVLAVNKWDTRQDDPEALRRVGGELKRQFPFLAHAPVVFMAGRTGYHVGSLFTAIDRVATAFRLRVTTGALNRAVEQLIQRRSPPMLKGRNVRVFYATQVGAAPPRFVLFTNRPEGLDAGYLRYLENGLRAAFDFAGTPIRLKVRQREQTARGRGGE